MQMKKIYSIPLLLAFLVFGPVLESQAVVKIQCPCDLNGDGDCEDIVNTGPPSGRYNEPALQESLGVTCLHLGGGDGFAVMADGEPKYIFGFSDLTGITEAQVMQEGLLAAAWPAPAIAVNEGEEFFLTLTNVGMLIRPDLFDPHTVHFHGFPQTVHGI
jgi:hypothetical protein